MRKILGTVVLVTVLTFAGSAAMAGNPAGSGQPGASCEDETSAPAGFSTHGFEDVADAHYAGSGAGSLHGNTATAVSQYDVACYQLSH
jgi:hypothetical protein